MPEKRNDAAGYARRVVFWVSNGRRIRPPRHASTLQKRAARVRFFWHLASGIWRI